MNANVSGLDETEELHSESPAADAPQPSMVDAPEPAQDGADESPEVVEETVGESTTPATMEAEEVAIGITR